MFFFEWFAFHLNPFQTNVCLKHIFLYSLKKYLNCFSNSHLISTILWRWSWWRGSRGGGAPSSTGNHRVVVWEDLTDQELNFFICYYYDIQMFSGPNDIFWVITLGILKWKQKLYKTTVGNTKYNNTNK